MLVLYACVFLVLALHAYHVLLLLLLCYVLLYQLLLLQCIAVVSSSFSHYSCGIIVITDLEVSVVALPLLLLLHSMLPMTELHCCQWY